MAPVAMPENRATERSIPSLSVRGMFFLVLCKKVDINKDEIIISTNDKHINYLISLLSEFEILNFEHLKETLEDFFMSYYKEDKEFGGSL